MAETVTGTGGTAVVAALRACGVRTVFGIPGSHNLEIYRALAGSGLDHVSLRHEQGLGFAADGYARSTGRPGVCLTTSGPGLTNIITAVATAHADSIPLLVVAPGLPRGLVGRDTGWLHELRDQAAVMAGVVDRSVRVSSADEAVDAITGAFAGWSAARPRPVYVEIPLDVLEAPWTGEVTAALAASAPVPSRAAIGAAIGALSSARHPVIVAGGGAVGAAKAVTALAERLAAPVVTTVGGKAVVREDHPLSVGASLRVEPGRDLVRDADLVLCVGTEVADTDLWGGRLAPTGQVLRVDVDEGQLSKNLVADIALHGAAAAVIDTLLVGLGTRTAVDTDGPQRAALARERIAAATRVEGAPWQALHAAFVEAMPPDVIVAGDSAQVSYYGTVHQWPMRTPRHFLYPTGYAPLGYGLPAAIGAKVADRTQPVLALVGDGGFQFTSNELMSAVDLGLNLPVVVVNNGGYGEIRREMTERDVPALGVDVTGPDLVGFARSFGAHGFRTADPSEAVERAAEALDVDRPTLIELSDAGTSGRA